MELQYQFLSKIYQLLDVVYFRNIKSNPRLRCLEAIPNQTNKVLELCTGTAVNAMLIAKNRPDTKVAGIDRSKDMLAIARRERARQNLHNLKLYEMDATQSDFAKESFDYVILSLVLHESSEELRTKLLEEAHRVLKPGGTLLVLEWEKPTSLLRRILFSPILFLEPTGFREFLQLDFSLYFSNNGFNLKKRYSCDYSQVFELEKK